MPIKLESPNQPDVARLIGEGYVDDPLSVFMQKRLLPETQR